MRASTSPAVRDAVYVFGPDGIRRAGSQDADRTLGTGRIDSIAELRARFRQPDGNPLDFDADGSQIAVRADGSGEGRFLVTNRLLGSDAGNGAGASEMCLVFRVLAEGEEPAISQGVIGSILAHELRTPMTTIFGGAQLVIDPSVSSATRTEAAGAIARETQHLHRVIEDLLVLVRSGAAEPTDLEPVLLQRVIQRVIDAQLSVHPNLRVERTVPEDLPAVVASEDEVEQLIDNLLSHAVRYSPPGTAVQVEARRAGHEVEVRILDEGPGRDAGDADRAFDLFTRSARSTADPSGANLALVVSRLIVGRMNGRIWAGGPNGGEVGFAFPLAE